MANRRYGNNMNKMGHGGGLGGPNFGQQPVSPWQGGSAPGALNPGLLSQLSAPHAQLALALTSLLQSTPQQQMNHNPPSLLSLSTSPNFPNQDNFGPSNRFANRGRDFRRSEPYNKNRGGGGGGGGLWRSEGPSFRNNSANYGNKNQGRNNFRPNSGFRKQNESKGKARNDKSNAAANKTAAAANKTAAATKTAKNDGNASKEAEVKPEPQTEVSRADSTPVAEEKKREWKEEKKGEEESANVKVEEKSEDGNAKTTKTTRDGKYFDIPPSLFHCFVCNKSMWDGESFQNHLRGKAHKQMMDSLEESCQITVNIMRENMRLAEEKKMIEIERMHRNNRNFHRKQQEPESNCNMCDLKFLGKIIAHRKTEGHQRLKRFLHPKCEACAKEFPSRMEWIDHRFTPEHLRQINEVLGAKIGGENGCAIEEEIELDLDPLLDETLQMESENPVLELSGDLKDVYNRIPAYKPSRAICKESVHSISGFYCDICYRFFVSQEVVDHHLKSERHHNSFVEAVKYKYQKQTEQEEAEANAEGGDEKRVKLEDDGEQQAADGEDLYDPEEACEETDANTLTLTSDADELLDDDEKKWAEVDATITKTDLKETGELGDPSDMPSTPQQRILRRSVGPNARNGKATRGRKRAANN